MKENETGIPQRLLRIFWTKCPCTFTGLDDMLEVRGDRLEERLDSHEARIVRLEEKKKKQQKRFQEV